ncbi:hypothetical protein, partial [Ruegeria denitrificans]|uniref:hypothetical protein n=1 Tax=Ruegeria denitrificans TaxID=1715692 RepID=UPI001A93DACB
KDREYHQKTLAMQEPPTDAVDGDQCCKCSEGPLGGQLHYGGGDLGECFLWAVPCLGRMAFACGMLRRL